MPSWWEAMGFEHERIESIGMEMFEVVEAGASGGKRRATAVFTERVREARY